MNSLTAVILINLGTPKACTLKAVRRFLGDFLMDPYVVQTPWILRALLVYGFILPFRCQRTLKAYQAIWDNKTGSPLLHHCEKLTTKLSNYLQAQYPEQYTVHLAMRYDDTDLNLKSVLQTLKNQSIDKYIVVPLYPQYAVSTSYSTIRKTLDYANLLNIKSCKIIDDFYEASGFIEAQAQIMHEALDTQKIEYVLFSFHSLPQRHINNIACHQCQHACPPIDASNRWCYRAQCFASARALANRLGLSDEQYGVSFQSRLGRLTWVGPYTEEKIVELAEQGIRHLAVVCPAFVADCLETQEEINIRLRASWLSLVNKLEKNSDASFSYIPCVNDHAQWVAGLGQIIHNKAMNTN